MLSKLEKAYLIGQVTLSILIVIMGIVYGMRCLISNQIFCALCFGAMSYISGYRFLFRASMAELKEFNSRDQQL